VEKIFLTKEKKKTHSKRKGFTLQRERLLKLKLSLSTGKAFKIKTFALKEKKDITNTPNNHGSLFIL